MAVIALEQSAAVQRTVCTRVVDSVIVDRWSVEPGSFDAASVNKDRTTKHTRTMLPEDRGEEDRLG